MTDTAPLRESTSSSFPIRVADLPNRSGIRFRLAPDSKSRANIAQQLEVLKLRKLTFIGSLRPDGFHDWVLEGTLGATAVQDCVVTGAPVTTRIDEPVLRRYLRQMPEIEGIEVAIPDDDSIEPLPPVIDLSAVMAEALALSLPDYPRVEGAVFDASASGLTEGEPERRNPFAALAALKDQQD
jgi:uncharacterized metal-binding protein YceD (DUF177 family)